MARYRGFIIIFLCSSLSLAVSCSRQKSEWPGVVEEADGVMVVQNPIEPMYEEAFRIEEELSIGAVEGPKEYLFSVIRDLAVLPNGNIYVLDSEEDHIKIFDSDGQYLDTIGTPGQGPGELERPISISISGSRLYVTEGARKFSVFSLEGEFEKRVFSKEVWALRARIDSLGRFIITSGVMDPDYFHYRLAMYDEEMNLIKEIATSPAPDARKGFNPFMAISYWTLGRDDRIIYGYPKDYELQIFDPDGVLVKKIKKNYNPVEITDEEKEKTEEDYQGPSELVFSTHHSAFRRFLCDDEGRLFVQTWEKSEGGDEFYYDVFDQEGKYIAKTVLPNRPHCFRNGRLYTIEEDEDGYNYVKRYGAIWSY